MFNITHSAKPGKCKARRCSHDMVESGLCAKHLAEWQAAGSPPFAETGVAISSAGLATPGLLESLAEEKLSAQRALEIIRETSITDQASMDRAGVFLEGVRECRTSLETRKAESLQPFKDSIASRTALYAPIEKLYEEAEKILREQINAHIRTQQEAQDRARLEVEAKGGNVDKDTLVVAHGMENVALPVGMGLREAWVYEVTDEVQLKRAVALSLVLEAIQARVDMPEEKRTVLVEFLTELLGPAAPPAVFATNTKVLSKLARELKGAAAIPGVRVYQNATATAARRSK